MDFPQYRKRFDNKSFYKVTSFTTFEEVQMVGKRFLFHDVHAKKYFEQLQIQDMLVAEIDMYQMSTAEEFDNQFESAKAYIEQKKNDD
ncbi:hypothetical protein [Brumimicrobium aurantiacum]|uniref:Uncharacterized protein n=1 Tax=Brumimicrobium aurantiacum TaxID=1737063 RepID=A0A3E1EVZ0_9FLAO|nr:hypothetical protein [Brumimicrobium aurantiacum]RFC53688.1 hypothetical protein DXU93_11200 [Brumimicrobium aurantiacum]